MRTAFRILVMVAAVLGLARDSGAAAIYQVNFVLPAAGQWFLDFQFVDGDGLQNNTAILSNFNFGLGSGPAGTPTIMGGASGTVASSVTLTDSSFFSAFTQPIVTGGSLLSFMLTLSTNANTSGAPDRFAFSLLDASGIPVPTTGLADEFLGIDITSPLAIMLSGSDQTRTTLNLVAPQVHAPTSVPEPAALAFLGLGLCLSVRFWSRSKTKD